MAHVSVPEGASKYDPLPGLLSADAKPTSEQQPDLLRGVLKAELPSGDSKYDPLRKLLSSEVHPVSEGRLDLLRGLLRAELPPGDSKYDPLPALLSSEAQQTPGDKLSILQAMLGAELPTGESKYDPLPELLTAEPQEKQNVLQSLLSLRAPIARSKFDPLKEILLNLRKKEQDVTIADHSRAAPSLAHSEEPSDKNAASQAFPSEPTSPSGRDQLSSGSDPAAAGCLRGGRLTEGTPSQEDSLDLGSALSSANRGEAAAAASQPSVFDPSFVRNLKGQFSESQSPDTGFPLDARDPRLRPEQKANLISMQPPSERPFAAGGGPGWLEEASTCIGSPEGAPAVANLDAAVAKVNAALEKTEKLQRSNLQVKLVVTQSVELSEYVYIYSVEKARCLTYNSGN